MAADRVKLPPALRSLVEAGGALVRRSSSGRFALGRLADLVPPDALPPELAAWPERLAEAKAKAATPLAFKDVEKALKGAWGRPAGKVLEDLEREPVAVTAGAQVHRATRADDGAAVAVKVLRPGLASSVRNDLALLDVLAGPLGAVFGAMDAGAILREVRETALDELDFEHEASTQRAVRRALRSVDGLVVSAADSELSAGEVLVSDWLEGPTLAGGAVPGDPAAVARTLVAAHVAAARAGFVLTDPRPGHVVLLDDGGVGLLGAGVARPADKARVAAALDALAAFRSEDQDAFAAIVAERLALLPAGDAIKAYGLGAVLLDGLLTGEARLDGPALAGAAGRALEHLSAALSLAATVTPAPGDLAVARSLGQLAGVLSALGATEDWGGLILEAA